MAPLAAEWTGMSPTAAVAAGAAAGVAVASGLLFTSVVLATLLVGAAGLDAVPAAVLAGATAWLVRAAAKRREAIRTAT